MNVTRGTVKSPDASLRFFPPRLSPGQECGVRKSTPHSSGFARLACGAFSGAARVVDALKAALHSNATEGSRENKEAIACCGEAVARGRRRRSGQILAALPPLAFLLFAGGCAGLPPIKPLDQALKSAVLEECRRPFLPGKYRLVHSLEALLPGGGTATAIGVLVADPRNGSFRSILMTIEGWVLFDIEGGATLTVHRAVPPFDPPAFARRMAEDIGLAFFPPGGEPALWGQGERVFRGCRYERPGGGFVDVLQDEGGAREIRLYGTGQELLKEVKIPLLERPGLADELEIKGEAWPSYTLRLRLIEAEPVED
jgi:hypothetical protein